MNIIKEFNKSNLKIMNNLVGLKLNNIFKQLDFFIINFGRKIEYSLHTYSFLRVRKGKDLIFTSTDEYLYPDNTRIPNEIYNKDEMHKKSLLPLNIKRVKETVKNAVVRSVEISDVADITIIFDNEVVIETFTDCLWQDNEYYRFFKSDIDIEEDIDIHYIVRFLDGKIVLEINEIEP